MIIHEFTAPKQLNDYSHFYCSVFLAGTIDNGTSSNWQQEFINKLKNIEHSIYTDYTIYNPRRDN